MDKIDQLLNAIEHPEKYSKSELEALLRDPEVREVYNLLDKTKSSMQPYTAPDVDAEWEAFESAHREHKFRLLEFFSRNTAASIAIGIASFAAVAAVVGVGVSHTFSDNADMDVPEAVESAVVNVATVDSTQAEPMPAPVPVMVIFDNEPFESIISQIAAYHGLTVEYASDAPKSLRLYFKWDQNLPVEQVIENLNNFERIHLTLSEGKIKID
ncbi:MAG: DUF4974 domain-containing protein [Bacteroides sp.]|nr:DUF4974 domain-containing protein [Bacteroides sp.]